MKLSESISRLVKEEIATKLYYRWDNEQIIAHILKRFPEVTEDNRDEIKGLVDKIEEKVTDFRLSQKKK